MNNLVHWVEGKACCDDRWEAAYRRFETCEQEVRKFRRRLLTAGAKRWPKDSHIVELCCGRGNGLVALASLGFTHLEGIDLSPSLLAQYVGPGKRIVGDCRSLCFEGESHDVVVVQGGLHHLPNIPDDLERVLSESRRVLRPSGRLVVIEPWDTAFLRAVHAACRSSNARRAWGRLNALATMIECEAETYHAWLAQPDSILRVLHSHFHAQTCKIAFGKLWFVGLPRQSHVPRAIVAATEVQ